MISCCNLLGWMWEEVKTFWALNCHSTRLAVEKKASDKRQRDVARRAQSKARVPLFPFTLFRLGAGKLAVCVARRAFSSKRAVHGDNAAMEPSVFLEMKAPSHEQLVAWGRGGMRFREATCSIKSMGAVSVVRGMAQLAKERLPRWAIYSIHSHHDKIEGTMRWEAIFWSLRFSFP